MNTIYIGCISQKMRAVLRGMFIRMPFRIIAVCAGLCLAGMEAFPQSLANEQDYIEKTLERIRSEAPDTAQARRQVAQFLERFEHFRNTVQAYTGKTARSGTNATMAAAPVSFNWYVSVNGNDNNSGTSAAAPLRTIGKAIEKASYSQVIKIDPGIYQECLYINKVITLVGNPGDPSTVVLNAQQNGTAVHIKGVSVTIYGLTITEGYSQSNAGSAIYIEPGMALLYESIITGNFGQSVISTPSTGSSSTSLHMRNCLVHSNSASGFVLDLNRCSAYLYNTTIADNQTWASAMVNEDGYLWLTSCILNNPAVPSQELVFHPYTLNYLYYNNIRKFNNLQLQGIPVTHSGNIDSDPGFVSRSNGMYQLAENSDCIDRGDPQVNDLNRPPARGGLRSDMGAYGGEISAQAYQVAPPDEPDPDPDPDPEPVPDPVVAFNVDNNVIPKHTNWVYTVYPQVATTTIPDTRGDDYQQEISYLDGFGRPVQSVSIAASPGRKDMVTPFVYDQFGRQGKQYLPYEAADGSGQYRYYPVNALAAFYNNPPEGVAKDATPYSETIFEPSPMNRVLEQYGPGAAWRTTAGQSLKTKYSANNAEVYDCRKTANGASFSHRYAVGTLHQVDTYDENNNITATEYIDLQGRLVRRVERGDRGRQYVYDNKGRVAYVLAPNVGTPTFTENDNTFKSCVFAYRYDTRGRVIRKHIPGAGWSSIVYNKLDQPVMTRDSAQLINNQWSFTKYDAHGRVVMTGTVSSSDDRQIWTARVEAAAQWEQRSTAAGNVAGYTSQSEPKNIALASDVHQVHYYDTYKNYPQATYCNTCSSRTQGLLTESSTRELGSSTFRNSGIFYDEKGRVARTRQQTARGDNITDYTYDFTGKVTKNVRNFGGTNVETEQDYDHAGRPTDTRMKAGAGNKVTTVRNEYNGLGQLIRKNLHSADNGASWLQQVDYRYNIRGWLTAINPDEDASDVYTQKLYYHENKPGFFATSTKRYNGDITGISWKTKAPGATKTYAHAYSFSYNTYEWLQKAAYTADTTGTATTKHYADRYNEEFAYDKTGNFTSLKRNAKAGAIDNLTYQYVSTGSPLLKNIIENVTTTFKDLGFKDSIPTLKYTYDVSGRLTKDLNKGMDITYNHLNLPVTVKRTRDNKLLQYTYLADGRRVKKTFGNAERHYIDGYEYEGATLKFISIPEGRIRKTGTGDGDWTYDYFIKDHLGNVRVVLTTAPSTQQVYMATMEAPSGPSQGGEAVSARIDESRYFNNIDETRADKPYNYPDNNPLNQKVAKVPGKSKGPSIMLRVMAGDTVSISAKAFYNMDKALPGQGMDITPVVGSAIAAMTNPTGTVAGEAVQLAADLGAETSQSVALAQIPKKDDRNDEVKPQAGINFVAYNAGFEIVEDNTGVRMVEDNINTIQILSTDKMVIQENGFLEVFVNNNAQTPVFFDNLMVTHTPSRVLEVNSYYPSGLLISGADMTFQAAGDEYNAYKYSAKELETALNLGWYDFGARPLTVYGGPRWLTPDPLAEKYYNLSPYVYAGNNPMRFIDPNGLTWYSIDSTGYISTKYEYDDGGHIVWENDRYDRLYAANGSYIQIDNQSIIPSLMNREKTGKKDMGTWGTPDLVRSMYTGNESSADDIFNTFLFASNNTDKEWRFIMHKGDDGNSLFTVGTLNSERTVGSASDFGVNENNVTSGIHSHPGISLANEWSSMGTDWNNVNSGGINYKSFVYMPNSGNVYKVKKERPVLFGTFRNKPNWRMLR